MEIISEFSNYFNSSMPLPSSTFYPVASALCLLYLLSRIRRRYSREPRARLKRQMDQRASFSEKASEQEHFMSFSYDLESNPLSDSSVPEDKVALFITSAPFPSACDILQPLSDITSIPTSGHVASLQKKQNRTMSENNEADNLSSSIERELSLYSPVGLPQSESSAFQSTLDSLDGSVKSPGSPDSPTIGDMYRLLYNLETPLLPISQPNPLSTPSESPETHTSSFGKPDREPASNRRVQKWSQTVRRLPEVDSEGTRTWKRLVVEYK